MSECERCQLELSGLWDEGRGGIAATRQSLLHLSGCAACQEFIRKVGSLGEISRALAPVDGSRSEGEASWLPQGGVARYLAAAAAIVALCTGAWLGTVRPAVSAASRDHRLEIQLAASRAAMTEERFLEITRELLEADHRYRRLMLQVLGEVESQVSQASGIEASNEEAIGRSEDVRDARRPHV